MSDILKETCSVLWDVLRPDYVKVPSSPVEWEGVRPSSPVEWEGVSRDFEQLWHFPHCIGKLPNWKQIGISLRLLNTGAIDGKHRHLPMLAPLFLIIKGATLLY